MKNNKNEKALLEAVSGLLKQKANLGVPDHEETSHTSQFRWEGIDDAYALKVSESPFFESLTSAFFQVHSYKYVDHPTFKLALEVELKNRALPTNEISRGLEAVDSLIEELSIKSPSERDAGWHPNLKDVLDTTRNADTRTPSKDEPFTGGGPWPVSEDKNIEPKKYSGPMESKAQDLFDLLLMQGVFSETDDVARGLVVEFSTLQAEPLPLDEASKRMAALATRARQAKYQLFAEYVETCITRDASRSANNALRNK